MKGGHMVKLKKSTKSLHPIIYTVYYLCALICMYRKNMYVQNKYRYKYENVKIKSINKKNKKI